MVNSVEKDSVHLHKLLGEQQFQFDVYVSPQL